jgi:hypothetical protein
MILRDFFTEAASPAQQAAIAIAMKKAGKKPKPEDQVSEACWKGYHKEGMKTMFGKRYPNCVKNKKSNEDYDVDSQSTQNSMKEAARVARKPGQPADSKKHSDLYTDENPRGTITGLKFATVEDARASVGKIRSSGRSHAHKIQAAVAMEQRAKAAGKAVDEMVVAVLDREYNSEIIQQIRDTGAATRLLLDGDVAGGIQAARGDSRIDICAGVGGSPEGIVTACGIRALGGFMQGILTPREDFERERGAAAGLKFDYVYEMNEMVSSDNTFFVATGVTDGALLSGVKKKGDMIFTESIVIRGRSGTVRKVFAEYQASRWI